MARGVGANHACYHIFFLLFSLILIVTHCGRHFDGRRLGPKTYGLTFIGENSMEGEERGTQGVGNGHRVGYITA